MQAKLFLDTETGTHTNRYFDTVWLKSGIGFYNTEIYRYLRQKMAPENVSDKMLSEKL